MLNDHRNRIDLHVSPMCRHCGYAYETVDHHLILCYIAKYYTSSISHLNIVYITTQHSLSLELDGAKSTKKQIVNGFEMKKAKILNNNNKMLSNITKDYKR